MEPRWVARLERKIGWLSVPGLAGFLAGMNALVGAMSRMRPDFPYQLEMDPRLVLSGEPWRLVTFLFVPPDMGALWLIFWLLLFYAYARALENAWGDFAFTVYCLVGAAALDLAALLFGVPVSATVFNMSLFLAFAKLNPEFEILLFFVLPVKMKYLAYLAWALILWTLLSAPPAAASAAVAGLANYLAFFGADWWQALRRRLR